MPKKDSSASKAASTPAPVDRKALIELLNEDLAREYQAIIAYIVYSQVLKGALHGDRERAGSACHRRAAARHHHRQADRLSRRHAAVVPKEVKTSKDPRKMLRFDLEKRRDDRTTGSACGSASPSASSRCPSTSATSS